MDCLSHSLVIWPFNCLVVSGLSNEFLLNFGYFELFIISKSIHEVWIILAVTTESSRACIAFLPDVSVPVIGVFSNEAEDVVLCLCNNLIFKVDRFLKLKMPPVHL